MNRLSRFVVVPAFASLLVLGGLSPGLAAAQDDPRTFADSGYTISDDAIWSFFDAHGGTATFGEPISREFNFQGTATQLFANAALQVEPDGSVQVLQITDPGLLPYTQLNGLTVPAADPATAYITPSPDQPNYMARLQVFLQATVPDTWNGKPVQFYSTFTQQGGVAVWGLPTSAPAADPNNPNFIYQRFQNGILLYDATAGSTSPLPLGEYLKDLLTKSGVPSDLASEAAASPIYGQYDLADGDAFIPDATS
jgi:hypothetical protein